MNKFANNKAPIVNVIIIATYPITPFLFPILTYWLYASPKTANVPYTKPTTPARPNTAHRAISLALQVLVLVALMVDIKTLANIIAPIVIEIIPVTKGLAIFYQTSCE